MKIEITNLNKAFGEQQVLKDFSLTVEDGRCTCVMGPSGSGKTTLLNIILGLEKKDSGTMEFKPSDEPLKPSVVFQEDRLIEGSDAFTNVCLPCRNKIPADELRQKFADIGLEDYEGKPVRKLSGGMQRRVAILRALLADYNLLVLDEPFKGLDDALKEKVIAFVKAETIGKTVLLVTHDITEANALDATVYTL